MQAVLKGGHGHRFIGYIDDLLFDQDSRFMDEFCPGLKIRFRTSTVIAQMNAVMAGSGIGVIPYFMAHGQENLRPDPGRTGQQVGHGQLGAIPAHPLQIAAFIADVLREMEIDTVTTVEVVLKPYSNVMDATPWVFT